MRPDPALLMVFIEALRAIRLSINLPLFLSMTNVSGVALPDTTSSPCPYPPSMTMTSLFPVRGWRVKPTPAFWLATCLWTTTAVWIECDPYPCWPLYMLDLAEYTAGDH